MDGKGEPSLVFGLALAFKAFGCWGYKGQHLHFEHGRSQEGVPCRCSSGVQWRRPRHGGG